MLKTLNPVAPSAFHIDQPSAGIAAKLARNAMHPSARAAMARGGNRAIASGVVAPQRIFDFPAALELAAGDGRHLAHVAEEFCERVHGLRHRIRQGIEHRDRQMVRVMAGSLRRSIRHFCALRALNAARELERAAAERDWLVIHRAAGILGAELDRLVPELARLAALPRAVRRPPRSRAA